LLGELFGRSLATEFVSTTRLDILLKGSGLGLEVFKRFFLPSKCLIHLVQHSSFLFLEILNTILRHSFHLIVIVPLVIVLLSGALVVHVAFISLSIEEVLVRGEHVRGIVFLLS